MTMRAVLAAALFLVVIDAAVAAPALAQGTPAGDPVLGERVVDGAATRTRLWLRNDKGAVVAFDRATGERTVVAPDGVIDLLRTGGVTAALRAVDGRPDWAVVTELETGKPLTAPVKTTQGTLLKVGADWIVLGPGAVWRSDGGRWRRRAFKGAGADGRASVAVATDGTIYVGFNRGEWGGGLSRLAPGSRRVTEVSRVDGDGLCDGPLNTKCDPVTGIIEDLARPGCVLASVGLSHMGMIQGRVLRVCGDKVEVAFSQKVGGDPLSFEVTSGATLPLFGLVSSPGGWTAATYDELIVSKDNQVTVSPMPALKPWSGLKMAEAGGVLLIPTDLNWAMSVRATPR